MFPVRDTNTPLGDHAQSLCRMQGYGYYLHYSDSNREANGYLYPNTSMFQEHELERMRIASFE